MKTTEILPLGNMVLQHQELGVEESNRTIKVLGVYFTNDNVLFYRKNFGSIVISFKEHLLGAGEVLRFLAEYK